MCLEKFRLPSLLPKGLSLGLICALLSAMALPALGQEATIVGIVIDPLASVLPNVAITATSIETGRIHAVTTNTSGGYVIPSLPVGHYSLKAEATGFKTVEQNGIVLKVGDRVRLDFRMQLGPVQETITVEAASVSIQADTGEVSSVVTGQQINQLATNGRSIYTLANLTPGSSSDQADFNPPTAIGGDPIVSFNGLRVAHNLYMLDGSETYDRGAGGITDIMPSLDAIAEFRMLTSNYSAEYGLSSAATMSAVLKSGTKRFHAAAWEFLRNDALDARNYFNRSPAPVAELRFNTFGFNLGGPVAFKRNYRPRTFFFYNMEWRRLIQGQTLNTAVPLASQYPDAGGPGAGAVFPTPITVPSGIVGLGAKCPGGVPPAGVVPGQLFPNNTIPSCMIDANAEALLAAGVFPKPSMAGLGYRHYAIRSTAPDQGGRNFLQRHTRQRLQHSPELHKLSHFR